MRERPSEQFLQAIGDRIRERRQCFGMSLDALADATDMSKAGLWEIERGNHDPRASTLVRLARALGCEVGELLPGREVPHG